MSIKDIQGPLTPWSAILPLTESSEVSLPVCPMRRILPSDMRSKSESSDLCDFLLISRKVFVLTRTHMQLSAFDWHVGSRGSKDSGMLSYRRYPRIFFLSAPAIGAPCRWSRHGFELLQLHEVINFSEKLLGAVMESCHAPFPTTGSRVAKTLIHKAKVSIRLRKLPIRAAAVPCFAASEEQQIGWYQKGISGLSLVHCHCMSASGTSPNRTLQLPNTKSIFDCSISAF